LLAIKAYGDIEKYADELSELVKVSRIDNKKFGNNIASHLNFLNNYNTFKYGEHAVNWYIYDNEKSIENYEKIHEVEGKSYPFRKYFEGLYLENKLLFATGLTRDILFGQSLRSTDIFKDLFITMMSATRGEPANVL